MDEEKTGEEFTEEYSGNDLHGQLYWNFFQNAPVGLFVLSEDGQSIVEINRRFTDMFGYTRDQITARCADLPWEQGLIDHLLALLDQNIAVDKHECCLKGKEGQRLFCQVSLARNKELSYLEGTVVDITKAKKLADDLKAEEAKFRLLSEQSLVGIMIIRGESIVYLNQAAADILEDRPERLLGVDTGHLINLICEEDRNEVENQLSKLRKAAIGFSSQFAYRVKTIDDGTKWINQYSKIERYQGEPGIVVNIVDINEYRRALEEKQCLEEQLLHAQKMESIGQLAAGIAHDFSNLLSPIISFSDILLDEMEITDRKREDIKQIRESAERGKALTHQLLAIGRKQEMEFQTLDLNQVVTAFQPILRRTIRENIDIQVCTTTSPLLFKGDPTQVEQILMNLAVNAQDAMLEGGRLTIETDMVILDEDYARSRPGVQAGSYIMLSVTDTGHGMDSDTRSKVFTPFYTTKELGKGTGLGLSTVYGIVKQHEGSIWVFSRLGQGTTFKIYFQQMSAPDYQMENSATQILEGAQTGNETVLIVEDDMSTRSVARRLLQRLGYTTIEAENGIAALKLFREHQDTIQLVLTDVIMPKMSGTELYQKLVTVRSDLKVLYMSGYTDSQVACHGVNRKSVHFIQKPFSLKHLAGKVREALDAD